MKSACGEFGAKQMFTLCDTLETRARNGSVKDAGDEYENLENEAARVCDALQLEQSRTRPA